uniref:Uncharacterized protein n=1 Tax=Romanomermis culicivorax TaxID=13658 RepID=A0A915KZS8_ROMCU
MAPPGPKRRILGTRPLYNAANLEEKLFSENRFLRSQKVWIVIDKRLNFTEAGGNFISSRTPDEARGVMKYNATNPT